MRTLLFAATIVTAGAVPLFAADAAPRVFLVGSAATSTLLVREAGEAPRREDRQGDRREDRREDRRSFKDDTRGTGLQARESSEAPRGKDGPHDRNRDGHSSRTPSGFDQGGIVLAREAGEGPRGEGKGHP